MTTWIVIVAVGAGSFLFRVAPLLLLQRTPLSAATDRVIRHAGLAAIAGLIATSVRHAAHGASAMPSLVAVGAGTVLVMQGSSMLRIIVVGVGIYAATSTAVGAMAW